MTDGYPGGFAGPREEPLVDVLLGLRSGASRALTEFDALAPPVVDGGTRREAEPVDLAMLGLVAVLQRVVRLFDSVAAPPPPSHDAATPPAAVSRRESLLR